MAERVYPATAPAAIGRGLVASSFQYYLSGAENLRLEIYSFTAAVQVDVAYRFWREDDRSIQIAKQSFSSLTYLATVGRNYKLDAGALLGVRVSTPNTTINYGHLFVRAQIIRGLEGGTEVLGTLLQGYINAENDRAWPGSPIEQFKDAPGVPTDIGWTNLGTSVEATIASKQRFRFLGGRVRLTTSAVVANRTVYAVTRGTSGLVTWTAGAPAVQTASQLVYYSIGSGSQAASAPTVPTMVIPFPAAMDLGPGAKVEFGCINIQAGDFFDVDGGEALQWLDP